LASRIARSEANFSSIQRAVTSVGRLYIHETSPRAKRFLERAAPRAVIPSMPSVALTVIEVIGMRKTW
jgi:hypothetical protein